MRIDFNVSGSSQVDEAKRKGAEFINFLESLRHKANASPESGGEINRLISIAQTEVETATMYAVKALTA